MAKKKVTAVLGILALSPVLAADDLPGLSLQLSYQLTPPAYAHAVDETARALLRVEWKVGESAADEAAAVDEMLRRLERIGQSIAQLQEQFAATPTGHSSKRSEASAIPAEPASEADGILWLPVFGGIAVLSLIGLFGLRRRRPPLMEEATFGSLITAQPAARPGVRTVDHRPAVPLPPIGHEPEAADDERPSHEIDRPTPVPPGDDQVSLELADILLAMGLADGAAKTLEDHIREHPRRALWHWLKLLHVYRCSNMQADFEKAAAEVHQQFNVAPTEWQTPETATPAFCLESYPHIRGRVQYLWHQRSCVEYLRQLLDDNRCGTRSGFPQPVVEEILLLLAVLRD